MPGRVIPEHPGLLIRRWLVAHRMTQAELALRTDYSAKHINRVVRGADRLKAPLALAVEMVTGLSARKLLQAQADRDLALARANLSRSTPRRSVRRPSRRA